MDWVSILIVGVPIIFTLAGIIVGIKYGDFNLAYLVFSAAFFLVLLVIVLLSESFGKLVYILLGQIGVRVSLEAAEKTCMVVLVISAALIFRFVEKKPKDADGTVAGFLSELLFHFNGREKQLIATFRRFVKAAETVSDCRNYDSCVEVLTKKFCDVLRDHRHESKTWSAGINSTQIAWTWISSLSFDLMSQSHNIDFGHRQTLLKIYKLSTKWCVDKKIISKETFDEQCRKLQCSIS